MTDDSPYQDAKDAGSALKTSVNKFGEAVKKIDDFAGHSTGRIIGPAATKVRGWLKAGIEALWDRWTTPHQPTEEYRKDEEPAPISPEPPVPEPEPETYDV